MHIAPILHTDVSSLDSCLWCFKPQSNVFVPSPTSFADLRALCALIFLVDKNVRLFLVGTLRLHCQLGRHDCGGSIVVDSFANEELVGAIGGECAKISLAEGAAAKPFKALMRALFTSRARRRKPVVTIEHRLDRSQSFGTKSLLQLKNGRYAKPEGPTYAAGSQVHCSFASPRYEGR